MTDWWHPGTLRPRTPATQHMELGRGRDQFSTLMVHSPRQRVGPVSMPTSSSTRAMASDPIAGLRYVLFALSAIGGGVAFPSSTLALYIGKVLTGSSASMLLSDQHPAMHKLSKRLRRSARIGAACAAVQSIVCLAVGIYLLTNVWNLCNLFTSGYCNYGGRKLAEALEPRPGGCSDGSPAFSGSLAVLGFVEEDGAEECEFVMQGLSSVWPAGAITVGELCTTRMGQASSVLSTVGVGWTPPQEGFFYDVCAATCGAAGAGSCAPPPSPRPPPPPPLAPNGAVLSALTDCNFAFNGQCVRGRDRNPHPQWCWRLSSSACWAPYLHRAAKGRTIEACPGRMMARHRARLDAALAALIHMTAATARTTSSLYVGQLTHIPMGVGTHTRA